MKNIHQMTRKEILEIPMRNEHMGFYDYIVTVPIRKLHDSGYRMMHVIGIKGDVPETITKACDALGFQCDEMRYVRLHSDILPRNGATRYFVSNRMFKVDWSCSSCDCEIVENTTNK